jgi:hypothetical protein
MPSEFIDNLGESISRREGRKDNRTSERIIARTGMAVNIATKADDAHLEILI